MSNNEPEIQLIDVGGQKLRTAVWKSEGNDRPILFFNGIGANLEMVAPLGEMMQHRSDVIVFDMPGIGGSPKAKIPYRSSTITKWANKILDHLGIDEVDVMGISWGGAVAQQYARSCPERAKSLVLLATSAGMVMIPGNLSAITKMASPKRYVDPDYMMKNFETLYGDIVDSSARGHKTRIQPPSVQGYMYQLLAMIGWTSVHFLPFLKQPTLVMSGDRDHIVPLANSRLLKSLIPHASLKIVKGGGHLFAVSRANQVIPIISSFLNDHAEPKANSA
ncbi:poly(3-hydroxyalkanoate) depolymerase [Kordiimonas sp. SCSIO 12610]|uniref:poly(3-hydroxyalkanoate) depolymerase n=1 Tax=Kordiimonas sp. SCSIO 12610 TaxID=2829597 RepID=UPI00210C649C|nr:poly(3-hydroxyalkanoate) depolymerase [Kordiimonas sp. SCSIO 12610]UTW54787.1 poly(3-hydroxyalkanoate) depolymerase [Kordiimonas sp. SCSIO 12610]